jgi:hypothetical protein
MAKIQEEIIIIKFSQLTKDGADTRACVTEDMAAALVQVAEELAGSGVVVELERT